MRYRYVQEEPMTKNQLKKKLQKEITVERVIEFLGVVVIPLAILFIERKWYNE